MTSEVDPRTETIYSCRRPIAYRYSNEAERAN